MWDKVSCGLSLCDTSLDHINIQGLLKLLKSWAGGQKPDSAEICLLLTNFALFLWKVRGQLTPLPPCFRRPWYCWIFQDHVLHWCTYKQGVKKMKISSSWNWYSTMWFVKTCGTKQKMVTFSRKTWIQITANFYKLY